MHGFDRLPPLDGLNALLAAADGGSFTAAAEMLGITHGSVSRRIAALEAWLGTALFERHGRGVRLTPAGQRFAADARAALATLAGSGDRWRPSAGRPIVRLSAVPSFARLWLLPRLAELERDDLRITLIADHRPNDLGGREADIAVRYGRGAWEGVDARPLLEETLVPGAAPGLAERARAELAEGGLPSLSLIHDSDSAQWRRWLRESGAVYRPRWHDRRFEDYDMVVAAARAGLGIAMLRLPLVEPLVQRGELAIVGTALPNPLKHFVCTDSQEARASVMRLRDRLLDAADG